MLWPCSLEKHSMTPDELSQWTPIGLTVEAPEPTVDWCDLRGISFREPFSLKP
jgi:hypothetical protein